MILPLWNKKYAEFIDVRKNKAKLKLYQITFPNEKLIVLSLLSVKHECVNYLESIREWGQCLDLCGM